MYDQERPREFQVRLRKPSDVRWGMLRLSQWINISERDPGSTE